MRDWGNTAGLWGSAAAAVALLHRIRGLDARAVTDHAPQGSLSFQAAAHVDAAAAILAEWRADPDALQAAVAALHWDFGLIVAYGLFLFLAARRASKALAAVGSRASRIVAAAAWLAPAACAFDVAENGMLLAQIPDAPSAALAGGAAAASVIKWLLILGCAGAAVAGTVPWLRPRLSALRDFTRAAGSVLWATVFPLIGTLIVAGFLVFSGQGAEILEAAHDAQVSRPEQNVAFLLLAALTAATVWACARLLLQQAASRAGNAGPHWRAPDRALADLVRVTPWIYAAVIVCATVLRFFAGQPAAAAAVLLLPAATALVVLFRTWRAAADTTARVGAPAPSGQSVARRRMSVPAGIALVGGAVSFVLALACVLEQVAVPRFLGSAAVLMVAACAWTVALSALFQYLPRSVGLPSLAVLVPAVIVAAGYFNDNHQPRYTSFAEARNGPYDLRTNTRLEPYLHAWLQQRVEPDTKSFPVVIVAAAGGGLRAAYWTAITLAQLHERSGGRLARHLFAVSGVSGGSLGAAAYMAALGDAPRIWESDPAEPLRKVQKFFAPDQDFLSPVLAALVLGDAAQRLLPFPIPALDRARALEDSWSRSWATLTGRDDLDAPLWQTFWKSPGRLPLPIYNATQVETGQRFLAAPVELQEEDFPASWFLFGERRRLADPPHVVRPPYDARSALDVADMPVKAAVHLSARFTSVSPAASFPTMPSQRAREILDPQLRADGGAALRGPVAWGRVVDGGYFENSGAATATDLVTALQAAFFRMQTAGAMPRDLVLYPIVLVIDNAPRAFGSEQGRDAVRFTPREPSKVELLITPQADRRALFGSAMPLSEPLSPLETLLATREARGQLATAALSRPSPVARHCIRTVSCEASGRPPIEKNLRLRSCDELPPLVHTVRLSSMFTALAQERERAAGDASAVPGGRATAPDPHEPVLGWYLSRQSYETMSAQLRDGPAARAGDGLIEALKFFDGARGRAIVSPPALARFPEDFEEDGELRAAGEAGSVCRAYGF